MNEMSYTAADERRLKQAMAALGIKSFHGLTSNGCTNRDRAHANMAYRDYVINAHPDKNGGQRMDPERLHKIMNAWHVIKDFNRDYRATAAEAIDLSQGDSDSEDTPDDLSDAEGRHDGDQSASAGARGEQAQGPPSVGVPDDEEHPLLLPPAVVGVADDQAGEGSDEPAGTEQAGVPDDEEHPPLLPPAIVGVADDQAGEGSDDLLGRPVSDLFWFKGTVEKIDRFERHPQITGHGSHAPMFQISYDDGDKEELYIEEYYKLPRGDCDAILKAWDTKYSFYKEFKVTGKVAYIVDGCSGNGEQYICIHAIVFAVLMPKPNFHSLTTHIHRTHVYSHLHHRVRV